MCTRNLDAVTFLYLKQTSTYSSVWECNGEKKKRHSGFIWNALERRMVNNVSGEEYSGIHRAFMLVQRKSNFKIYSLPKTQRTAPRSKGNDLFTNTLLTTSLERILNVSAQLSWNGIISYFWGKFEVYFTQKEKKLQEICLAISLKSMWYYTFFMTNIKN